MYIEVLLSILLSTFIIMTLFIGLSFCNFIYRDNDSFIYIVTSILIILFTIEILWLTLASSNIPMQQYQYSPQLEGNIKFIVHNNEVINLSKLPIEVPDKITINEIKGTAYGLYVYELYYNGYNLRRK